MRSTSEIADIFTIFDEIFLVIIKKKKKKKKKNVIFLLIFSMKGNNFFRSHFSLILLGLACLVVIIVKMVNNI